MSATAKAAIRYGRRRAESEMVDTCVITRVDPDAPWTVDPDSGLDVPPGPVTVYDGRCKLQSFIPHERTPDVGGQSVIVQRTVLHIPVGHRLLDGDRAKVTDSIDPDLVGRTFRVSYNGPYKTWGTAIRVYVDEVT